MFRFSRRRCGLALGAGRRARPGRQQPVRAPVGGDQRHQRGTTQLRPARIGRRRDGCAIARRTAPGQPVGEPVAGARPAHCRPAELRAGPADFLARVRRPLDLRDSRHSPVRGRDSGHHARRPGPGVALRAVVRRQSRGAARPVLGAARQCLRWRDFDFHRGWSARAARLGFVQRRQLRIMACGHSRVRRAGGDQLSAGSQPLRHRRLPPAQRGATRTRKRQAQVPPR